jgi:hypothetical protein
MAANMRFHFSGACWQCIITKIISVKLDWTRRSATDWDELLEVGAKLTTKNEDGSVAHWGVMISNNSGWASRALHFCIARQ